MGGFTRNKPMKKYNNLVIGIQPIKEAIDSGSFIEKVMIRKGLRGDTFKELFDLIRDAKVPFQFVPDQKLNQISRKNHQGVIAFISPIEYQDIDNLVQMAFESGKPPCFLMLDGVTDVRNLGAIARSAECFGANGIIIPEKGSAAINDVAIKSSAGALLKLNVSRVKNLDQTLKTLVASGLHAIACDEKSEKPLWDSPLDHPCVIVLGAEDTGVSADVAAKCTDVVKIPMTGSIASLNVSVSAGIMLAELTRQRLINKG
ncbi:MAG: 23S rRNA (guanosine(2251)-2'-O)-methyltransferase RlmB [Flavobacteriales bacterium]|nr:23S rRNA (guanosine(2251)-2'-O)-methyltransferase RlmB [Flavobacteriales bacterium]